MLRECLTKSIARLDDVADMLSKKRAYLLEPAAQQEEQKSHKKLLPETAGKF